MPTSRRPMQQMYATSKKTCGSLQVWPHLCWEGLWTLGRSSSFRTSPCFSFRSTVDLADLLLFIPVFPPFFSASISSNVATAPSSLPSSTRSQSRTLLQYDSVYSLFISDTTAPCHRRSATAFVFALPFSFSPSYRLIRRILVFKRPHRVPSKKKADWDPFYRFLSICVLPSSSTA